MASCAEYIRQLKDERHQMIAALNEINHIVFQAGVGSLGPTDYFRVRNLCCNTIRAVRGEVK